MPNPHRRVALPTGDVAASLAALPDRDLARYLRFTDWQWRHDARARDRWEWSKRCSAARREAVVRGLDPDSVVGG